VFNYYTKIEGDFLKLIVFFWILSGVYVAGDNIPLELFTESELRYLSTHSTIKVSNELDYAPYDFAINGEPCGYSIDIVKIIAEHVGLQVEFINGYTWHELLELFKNGKIDLMHSITKTDKREQFGLFSVPYCHHPTHFIVRKDSEDIDVITQLYGKKVAVGKSWAVEDYLKRNHPDLQLVPMDNIEMMLDALSTGKVDAVINGSLTTEFLMRKLNYGNIKVSGLFKEFAQYSLEKYHFMGKKSSPELISIFNKVFYQLPVAKVEKIRAKWFGESANPYCSKLSLFLSFEEKEYLHQKKVLKYCVDPDWMPYEKITKDGVHIGISADYIDLFSERLGVEFQLHETSSWTESMQALKNTDCDLIALITPNNEREILFDLTSSYVNFPTVIATRNSDSTSNDINFYLDKSLACVEGYSAASPFMKKYEGIKLSKVSCSGDGLRAVKEGRFFGYIDLLPSIMYASRVEGIDGVKVSCTLTGAGGNALASRKDEPVLGTILQKAVDSLTEEDHQRINNKWLAVTVNKVVDYSLVWRVVASVIVILALFIYWNRRLKRAKLAVELALKAEKEAVQQNLNFIDMISHEYRTPLSVINSCLDVVERKYSIDKFGGLEAHINNIREASIRLLNIFESSLKKNNDSYGDISVNKKNLNLKEIIKATVTLVQCAYPKHQFLVNYSGSDFQVVGDKELLTTVFSNILDNAGKYSDSKNKIIIEVRQTSNKFYISVKDSGMGIAPADIKQIFGKYYRSQHVGEKRGAGVGLFLVKKIIDIHNGEVSVNSELGQGSIFRITIPVGKVKDE